MTEIGVLETRRRSIVKSLLWRGIGVLWTWSGAFVILLLLPSGRHRAAWAATAIVIYHHATRMIVYYFYERIWTSVKWGRAGAPAGRRPITFREGLIWTAAILAVVAAIFSAILFVGSLVKAK